MSKSFMKWMHFIILLFIFSVTVGAQPDTLTVLQMTDIHYCNLTGYHPEFIKQRQHYGKVDSVFQSFLSTASQKTKADLIVITGDLIDYFEAETARGPWQATQIEQFVPLLSNSTVPVYLTLGNHDIASYWIEGKDDKESWQFNVQESRAAWIRNAACFQQGTWYSRDYKVGDTKYRFVFLDNGYSLGNGAVLDKIQLDWLDNEVKQAKDSQIVIFMHKYIPVKDYNNDGSVLNSDTQIELNNNTCSKGMLKILNDNPNIKAIFNGHGHRSVIEPMNFPSGNIIIQTETAAFAQNINNWRLIKFTENSTVIMVTGAEKSEYVFEF